LLRSRPRRPLCRTGPRTRQRPPLTPEQEAEQKRRAADTAIAEGVRPIDMLDSVWIEELSWMEVRDLIKDGKTTAFLGVGGVEKNGPYTATGKHNYTLKTTLEAIGRKHGKALVAPLVTWEPCNPDRENLTPGTFCVSQETYRALLRDAITSLKSMGMKDIVLVADSGGNPPGLIDVANELNAKWKGTPARVFYIPEYYDGDRWSYDFKKQKLGITQIPDGTFIMTITTKRSSRCRTKLARRAAHQGEEVQHLRR
jgi:creatinine amidohydrolase/Fe(II)-dependent formamide hydrolase-like protein